MLRLVLMRHAEAEPAKDRRDHARPLSRTGVREADAAGRALSAAGLLPDLALASDSTRTVATLERVAALLPAPPARRILPALYGATPAAILTILRAMKDDPRTVLLIGHNPGIGQLARDLAGSGDPAERAALAAHFPTACFAVLSWDASDWRGAGPPARLDRLHGAKPA